MDGLISKIHRECGDDHGIELEIEVLITKLRQAFWKDIKEGLNPQGLRIQVFPNLWDTKNEFEQQWEANLQDCTVKMMTSLNEHYNRDIRDLDIEIIEFQKQNMSLCAYPKFSEKDKLLKEYLEKHNKDLIYKKDMKFIQDKMAFNGKYAYKWPQQGGRKGRNNRGNKNKHISDGDMRDGTNSNSSTVSYSSCLSQFTQAPNRGRGRQRGSRKRQTTGDNHNGGGRDKKIKEHLYDKNYDPDISTDNTVGDELLNDKIQTMRGASGSDALTEGNRTLMSPSSSTYMHPNTPRNLGTIPKTGKDTDFKLFPPTQQINGPPQSGQVCIQNHIENQLQVINLSTKVLSQIELEVLGLGLSFCQAAHTDSLRWSRISTYLPDVSRTNI